jgi:hypothetical protein
MAGGYEHGNDISNSTKGGEFLEYLNNLQNFLKGLMNQ